MTDSVIPTNAFCDSFVEFIVVKHQNSKEMMPTKKMCGYRSYSNNKVNTIN